MAAPKEVAQNKLVVLLIDNDKLPMRYYERRLEQIGFRVEFFKRPDPALEFARNNPGRISAIVMGILLSPGNAYRDKDTREGLETGVFLYPDLRDICPDIPIIVLTDVKDPETLGKFPKNGPRFRLLQKLECPPFKLAELVSEMLSDEMLG